MNELCELELLKTAVEEKNKRYNPSLSMLTAPYHTNGYHTVLKNVDWVHPCRESIEYALALLDTGGAECEERAFAIIRQVISLQDQHPAHDTYGLWSYYYEEPLEMMAPPDWNWADFIGKVLVMIAKRHRTRLPEALLAELEQAVCHACESIIRRNMGPHYTNIAIMGSLVTIGAGEVFGHQRYLDYGLKRFEAFCQYTQQLNTFQEYNSPTYTIIAIIELSKIRQITGHPKALEICGKMLDLAWSMVGAHFHAATRQWAGPHSRSYSTLLTKGTLAFLSLAAGIPWREAEDGPMPYNLEWFKSGVNCPEKYRGLFAERTIRDIQEIYYRSQDGYEKVATTYMTPSFTIASASKEVMWNQRRNLLAYVADNEGKTAYAALRMLHDGYDFSAPVFSSQQDQGHILCGLQLSVNGGDTHIGLDRIDGAVEASDLRLRLEIGGAAENVEAVPEEGGAVLRIGSVRLELYQLAAVFEGGDGLLNPSPEWTIGREDGKLNLDLVLYHGPRKKIDIAGLHRAGLIFALSMEEEQSCGGQAGLSPAKREAMRVSADGQTLEARWQPADKPLALSLTLKPDKVETLRGQA